MSAVAVERPARSPPGVGGHSATRTAVSVLGTLVGLAGVEHGVGEAVQDRGPGGVLIMSWPDAAALEVLSGEPAMTVIPDLLVTGALAIVVGLLVTVWSIGFAHRRHGGLVLIGLSVVLLLVGGGIAPPVMGVILGGVATRIGSTPRRPAGRLARRFGRLWPWFLTGAVLGYLGLMPGMLLFHPLGVANAELVVALALFAFANLGLALGAARAHDRASAVEERHS
jgi:hypothetical protein